MKRIDDIAEAIIGDAISVHRQFGAGLLESTDEFCLAALLSRRGLQVEWQVALPASVVWSSGTSLLLGNL